MDSAPRTLTLARILGLVAIGLVAAGLAYLRFAPAGEVSVPEGAHAGQLTLHSCDYSTEDGSYDADCGTLVVPENRQDPDSRLIALPVKRIHARSAQPREPIFRLEGGPGITNMEFLQASRYAGKRDVVLVGYRGVDGSSKLDCPEVVSAMRNSTDFLGADSLREQGDAFRECAARLEDDGVDLAGYTLTQRVEDLEAARRALGYDRVDLVSESAGTRTALVYAWRHPERIHRSILIAANPPGHFLWDAETIDRQIRRYSELCSEAEACRERTNDLAALMDRKADAIPDSWGPLDIKKGNVRVATFWGLIDSGDEAAPLSAPMTLDSWLAAGADDASGFWFQSLASSLFFPPAQVWGDVAAIGRADANYAASHFPEPRDSILGDPGSSFIWAGGRLADAWPAAPDEDDYDQVRTSEVETLVVSGSMDFATPAENATRELMPHLPNGHQVILREFGHSGDFWTEQKEAGTHLINTYLDSGRVDDSGYELRKIDFRPDVTQASLGKGLAGGMLGFALITLFSLMRMPLRVKKRGHLGGRSSTLLRSLYPLVLGLGGWFLASLTVLIAAPGVPIDGELLVALSMGIPIGLGIYWAWVRRDWPAETKRVGLAAAVVSAIVGGWLGFKATGDLLAVFTTIAGSAAAANLALIVLSIARERTAEPKRTTERTLVGTGAAAS
jgi:pimeloyl-ACP methyl ester carboxylesterase